jgi:hypothetical protein
MIPNSITIDYTGDIPQRITIVKDGTKTVITHVYYHGLDRCLEEARRILAGDNE